MVSVWYGRGFIASMSNSMTNFVDSHTLTHLINNIHSNKISVLIERESQNVLLALNSDKFWSIELAAENT